jgi:hypothetical protein
MVVSTRVLAGLALMAFAIAQFGGVDLALAGGGAEACAVGCPSPHAAPGPIVGAGLPILAIGFGAYWLTRRFRGKPN